MVTIPWSCLNPGIGFSFFIPSISIQIPRSPVRSDRSPGPWDIISFRPLWDLEAAAGFGQRMVNPVIAHRDQGMRPARPPDRGCIVSGPSVPMAFIKVRLNQSHGRSCGGCVSPQRTVPSAHPGCSASGKVTEVGIPDRNPGFLKAACLYGDWLFLQSAGVVDKSRFAEADPALRRVATRSAPPMWRLTNLFSIAGFNRRSVLIATR